MSILLSPRVLAAVCLLLFVCFLFLFFSGVTDLHAAAPRVCPSLSLQLRASRSLRYPVLLSVPVLPYIRFFKLFFFSSPWNDRHIDVPGYFQMANAQDFELVSEAASLSPH